MFNILPLLVQPSFSVHIASDSIVVFSHVGPKFISVWLALQIVVWFAYPLIVVVFTIWLHRQPRTHFQERTINAEIIVLAIVTIFNFAITPYFLVVAKSFRSKLIKENEREYGHHI